MSYQLEKNGIRFMPAGVSQNTTAVSTPATCGTLFTLPPQGSCTLVLNIAASQLSDGKAIGGPEVCNSKENPVRCSFPDDDKQLNISVTSLSVAAGHIVLLQE